MVPVQRYLYVSNLGFWSTEHIQLSSTWPYDVLFPHYPIPISMWEMDGPKLFDYER